MYDALPPKDLGRLGRHVQVFDERRCAFVFKSANTSKGRTRIPVAHRATFIGQHPADYFVKRDEDGSSRLRVADVVLRANHNPKHIVAHLIRFATNSAWSRCALVFLLSNQKRAYDSTFLIEAMTAIARVVDWRKTIVPYKQFTVAIKRLPMDWYAETHYEQTYHNLRDPEGTHGIDYLRSVRGRALDQVNDLYDRNVIFELSALFLQRVAKRHSAHFLGLLGWQEVSPMSSDGAVCPALLPRRSINSSAGD